jgi:hypothetical protein
VPSGDLVNQFMAYTEGMQSCTLYRKWCAITMVAGAMERRIKAISGRDTNYANLYVMLVGPPGSGKSVINVVRDLWDMTRNELGAPAFYSGANDSTKAALFDALNNASQIHTLTQFKYHCLLLPIEEFSNSFSKFEADILAFLTTIYDAPPHFKEWRRKSGETRIDYPLITALFGYQPALLEKILMKDAQDQGFLRRSILVWNEVADRISPFNSPTINMALQAEICERLSEISLICGEMEWSQGAKDYLTKWHLAGGPPRPLHEDLKNYNTSRSQFVMKLSMIASMSESPSMSIQLSHVERALQWLLEVEDVMPNAFNSAKGESEIRVIRKLHAAILVKMSAGQPITTAFLHTWLSERVKPQVIPYIIQNLVVREIIVQKDDKTWRVTGKTLTDLG